MVWKLLPVLPRPRGEQRTLLCDLDQVPPLIALSLGKFGGGRCLQAFPLNGARTEEKALGACLPVVRSLANQAVNGNLMPHSQQGSAQSDHWFCPKRKGRACQMQAGSAGSSLPLAQHPLLVACWQLPAPSRQDEGLPPARMRASSQMEKRWESMRMKESP